MRNLLREYVRVLLESDDDWGEDTAPSKQLPKLFEPYAHTHASSNIHGVTHDDIMIDGDYDDFNMPPDSDGNNDGASEREAMVRYVLNCFDKGWVEECPGAEYYDYDSSSDTLTGWNSQGRIAMWSDRLRNDEGGFWDEEFSLE